MTGGTLIVDEFDASIHPMALMNIINIFHNDEINIHHAQLIFNTHNPIFLNSNILRRDEIKFVERDDDTHLSTLYALSDFGTTGDKGVRKHDDYFTVEGETEKWYLEWLRDRINECEEAEFKVSFDAQIQKNPLKRAKSLIATGKTEIWHLSDYESDDPAHVKQFLETMDNMKAAANIGKQITYKFGYTNLTFDLWIILHKASCNGSKAHRKNYITPLKQRQGSYELRDL